MKYLTLILFLAMSCSKHKVNIAGIPNKVQLEVKPIEFKLQLDLEKADKICNDRFGIDTELSDKCFMAYLEFFKVSIELTTQGIEDYCKQTSADPIKVSECEQNMFNFFNNLGRLRG